MLHDSRGIDRHARSIDRGGNDSRWVTSSAMQGQGHPSLPPLRRASFSRRRWRRSRGFERDYERGPGAKPRCHNRTCECTNRDDGDFTRPPSLSKGLFCLPPNILPPPYQFGILSAQLICLPALLVLSIFARETRAAVRLLGINGAVCKVRNGYAGRAL